MFLIITAILSLLILSFFIVGCIKNKSSIFVAGFAIEIVSVLVGGIVLLLIKW